MQKHFINQVLNYEWQKNTDINGTNNGFKPTRMKGSPLVGLYFLEPREDLDPGYPPIQGFVSFRLLDKSELANDDAKRLTPEYIQELAVKIYETFAKPTPHKWKRGRETVSYFKEEEGFKCWGYFFDKNEALELYTKLVSLTNKQLDLKRIKYSTTEDAAGAYPTIPPSINILGKQFQGKRKRPVGNTYFEYATLQLASLSRPISLATKSGVKFDSGRFAPRDYII